MTEWTCHNFWPVLTWPVLTCSVLTWPVLTWTVQTGPVLTSPALTWLDLTWPALKQKFLVRKLNQNIARFKKKFCIRKLLGPRKYWDQNIWALRNLGLTICIQNSLCSKNLGPKKYFGFKWILNLHRHLLCTLPTPSLYTNQTPFGHPQHTLKTPTKFQPPVLHKSWIFN